MKIFITVGIFPPDIGGPASFVPKIADLLIKSNHEVKVLCLSNEKNKEHYNYEVFRVLRSLPKVIRWPQTIFKMIKYGRKADLWFINGLPMESYISHKFINLILRRKIITIRKIVGDWAWERGRNLNLTEDSFDEFQRKKHSLHLEIAKFSRGWTANKVDKVIVPSQHLKNVVNNWGVFDGKIDVIYNGTKIIQKDPSSTSKDVRIISVGRLAPWKNLDVIIDAIETLNNNGNKKYTLTLVGDGPIRKKLENRINLKSLQNLISITGQIPSNKVDDYLKKADIYIQASGYEGLPHVILEAINNKLTIISTPIGGTNEILEDGKYGWVLPLVDNKKPDSKELTKLIDKVEKNKKEDNKIREKAYEMLKVKFDENINLNKYIEIINNFNQGK